MIVPQDFTATVLNDSVLKKIKRKITFEEGGPEMEKLYPDGIPTIVKIKLEGNIDYKFKLIEKADRSSTVDLLFIQQAILRIQKQT